MMLGGGESPKSGFLPPSGQTQLWSFAAQENYFKKKDCRLRVFHHFDSTQRLERIYSRLPPRVLRSGLLAPGTVGTIFLLHCMEFCFEKNKYLNAIFVLLLYLLFLHKNLQFLQTISCLNILQHRRVLEPARSLSLLLYSATH